MPQEESTLRLESCRATTEMELLSLRTDELSLRLEEMILLNSTRDTQPEREQEASEAEIRKLDIQRDMMRMQFEEDRQKREHAERMRKSELEENNKAREHEQESLRMKLELAKTAERTELLKNEESRRQREYNEQLEGQRRNVEEQNIGSLKKLGLTATAVGAASGAIGGALGTTANVGVAAVVAGAATVVAPVAGAVAIVSGAGYVYKKATSSRA